jgi:CoA:oxalate CoA-transferase
VGKSSEEWLRLLEHEGLLCSDVLDWHELITNEAFQAIGMTQRIYRSNGTEMMTLRCPIRVDGQVMMSDIGSPTVGEHNQIILEQLGIAASG